MIDIERNYDTMSNMKDYAMWLDDRGIATWDNSIGELVIPYGVDIHDASTVDEYKSDTEWHNEEPDDDEILSEEEEELIIDDGDYDPDEVAYSPDEHWFHPDGGLTGDAYDFLASVDAQGEFV